MMVITRSWEPLPLPFLIYRVQQYYTYEKVSGFIYDHVSISLWVTMLAWRILWPSSSRPPFHPHPTPPRDTTCHVCSGHEPTWFQDDLISMEPDAFPPPLLQETLSHQKWSSCSIDRSTPKFPCSTYLTVTDDISDALSIDGSDGIASSSYEFATPVPTAPLFLLFLYYCFCGSDVDDIWHKILTWAWYFHYFSTGHSQFLCSSFDIWEVPQSDRLCNVKWKFEILDFP